MTFSLTSSKRGIVHLSEDSVSHSSSDHECPTRRGAPSSSRPRSRKPSASLYRAPAALRDRRDALLGTLHAVAGKSVYGPRALSVTKLRSAIP